MIIRRLFLGLSALFLFFSCTNSPSIPENDPGFSEFILAHSSGVISAYSNITLQFNQDLNPGVSPGTLVEAELFQFSPDIPGQAQWESANTIIFIPEKALRPGQVYEAEFELGAVLSIDDKLSTFEFGFQAIEQSFTLLNYTIKPYQNNNLVWNLLSGEISAADLSNIEELRKLLTFKKRSASEVKWTMGSDEHRWIFEIDSMERKEESYQLIIEGENQEIGSLKISSLSDFEVLDVSVQQLPIQKVTIAFSDPLSERQNTDGMFQLNDVDVASIEIEGSVVHLYPSNRVIGTVDLKIFPGLKNILGYSFPSEYLTKVSFDARKPQVRFVNSGTIIPTTGSVVVPFEAVSLRAVDVKIYQIFSDNVHQFLQVNSLYGANNLRRVARPIVQERISLNTEGINPLDWNAFTIDLDKIIERDPGAIYRIELDFKQSYSLFPCGGANSEGLQSLEAESWEEEEESFENEYWDSWYFPGYDWEERDNPCHVSYFNNERKIGRNILASDIGLVVKGSKKTWITYTQSISTTAALSGVKIKYFNYQGQLIKEVESNSEGYAKVDLDTRPFLVLAQNGLERSYQTLENSNSLSLSSFDVGGRDISDGLDGMIYSERGIWRPGDTIFLDFILSDRKNPLPEDQPIILNLKDSRGQEVYRTVKSRGTDPIFTFAIPTNTEGNTGTYSAQIQVGGKSFYKSLPVETIQPNRLDISISAPNKVIDGSTQGSTDILLKAEWLTGAKASGLKAEIRGNIRGNAGAFAEDHPNFDFTDDTRSVPNISGRELFTDALDDNGFADIRTDLGYLQNSPGMLRLSLGTKVFEPGGRFSINSTTLDLAPFKHFVGLEMPKTNQYGYLDTEKDHRMGLIRVDQNGKPTEGAVKISIYKVNWSWWWSAKRGKASYLNNESSTLITSETLTLKQGRGPFNFNIPDNLWGRLFILVEDVESGHRSSSLAYIDWGWGRDRSGRASNESVSVLNVQTDKEKYEVGETATISVPSAAGGRLILSYENGQGQLKQAVIPTQEGQTTHELKITADMAPNFYAHAMLLQPHNSKSNDLPLRLYGIIPVLVENPATHLEPIITAPKEIRPNTKYSLEISEKEGKAMDYTLAIVDEGLLGLTNFKTPKPWDHFYSKKALGLRTWDLYDAVIGGYSGEIARVLSVGGDAALLQDKEEDADRFIPVVRHLGPFHLDEGDKGKHELQMPNYLGNVRVMVVAANTEEAYGSAYSNIKVKQPLMVQMTVPRVLGPEEEMLVPVTVFAMNDKIRTVSLKMEAAGLLTMLEKTKTIRFTEEGQKTVYFSAKVARSLGKASLKITASSGSEKSFEETEITVRSPLSMQQKVYSSVASPSMAKYTAEPFGIKGSNTLKFEVSTLPKLNLSERMQYLIGYPHGCLEQTTSKSFAQLSLEKWVTLNDDQKADIQSNVNAGLSKLQTMQMADGGFRYWPGYISADHWGTTYVGHFLISAEKAGYKLPTGMKSAFLRFAHKEARRWNSTDYYRANSDLNQAYRLYVLALAGQPETGAMTRLRNNPTLSKSAAIKLASAYALIGEKDAAKEFLAKEHIIPDLRYRYYNYGSALRELAMEMEVFHDIGNTQEAMRLAKEVAEGLSNGWHSTQSTAYSLQALSRVFESGNSSLKARITINGKAREISTDLAIYSHSINDFNNNQQISVESLSGQALYFTAVREGLPVYGQEEAASNRVQMTLRYEDGNGKEMDPSILKIGTPIIAYVRISSASVSRDFENLALTQIFPSGWEITNSRVLAASTTNSSYFDYQDIRDDRVLTYFNGYRNPVTTIRVELTATYPGKWYLAPSQLEGMYEGSIYANNVGQWIEVVVD